MPAQFIPGRTGAGLLILNGFTFYMKNHQAHGKKQWYCSSRDVHGCRADVITYKGVDGRDYISIFRGRHIHDPPRLRQCHDGRFIREKYFFNKQSLQWSLFWLIFFIFDFIILNTNCDVLIVTCYCNACFWCRDLLAVGEQLFVNILGNTVFWYMCVGFIDPPYNSVCD